MFEPWEVALLEECRSGRLGTINEAGAPHLVPVCYALMGGRVVIAVDEKPKRSTTELARLRNIRRDPRVTFLVDRYSEDWTQLAWLRVDGKAAIEPEGGANPAALDALRARYPQYRAMTLERLPLIAISPERVSGWRGNPAG